MWISWELLFGGTGIMDVNRVEENRVIRAHISFNVV